MDLPVDLESPCSAIVPQRAVREWHCDAIVVGAGPSGAAQTFPHLYLNPVPWVFLQCLLSSLCCTASLFSSFLRVLDQVGWVFNPPLCPVAELQSAPPWSHLPIHFRFQTTKQRYSAAVSSCLCAKAVVTDPAPRHLRVWSCAKLNPALLRNMLPINLI